MYLGPMERIAGAGAGAVNHSQSKSFGVDSMAIWIWFENKSTILRAVNTWSKLSAFLLMRKKRKVGVPYCPSSIAYIFPRNQMMSYDTHESRISNDWFHPKQRAGRTDLSLLLKSPSISGQSWWYLNVKPQTSVLLLSYFIGSGQQEKEPKIYLHHLHLLQRSSIAKSKCVLCTANKSGGNAARHYRCNHANLDLFPSVAS